MMRRPLAFVLAAIVMALPIARQLCDAACADSAIVEHAPHHHHSSAAPQMAPEDAKLDQRFRACVTLDAIVTDSRESRHVSGAAPAGKSFSAAATDPQSAISVNAPHRHPPPLPVRAAALRI
jgi:hypothetical protein